MRVFIKGFKSIAEGQYVAIGKKLTFLVGPNSAGKSVVYHALSKLQSGDPLFGLDAAALHYNGSRDVFACQQSLGVEWEDGNDVLESRVTYLINTGAEGDDHDLKMKSRVGSNQLYSSKIDLDSVDLQANANVLEIRNGVVEHESMFDSRFQGVSREKYRLQNACCIYPMLNYESLCINNHSADENINDARDFLLRISQLIDENGLDKNFGKEYFSDWAKSYDSGFFAWDPVLVRFFVEMVSAGLERQILLNQFFHHDAFIKRRVKKINNEYTSKNPLKKIKLVLVSADRVLPCFEDLHCTVSEVVPKNIYHLLARSFVERDWGFDYVDDEYFANPSKFSEISGKLVNRVNEALAGDLFIDNGYQVHILSSLILPRVGVDNFLEKKGRVGGGKFTVRMELMDSHGRFLGFDQVGSGIGYVLPVLVEALNSRNAGAIVFLQQPELHLHPAMQASLSDVLIDAADDKRILVETHSEHMILRALKRIRQTFNETLMEKNLHLTYEDVAVNYFEPQGDGTTKVHIIRVAPDGEFIDRWPHGFFPERNRELFDE